MRENHSFAWILIQRYLGGISEDLVGDPILDKEKMRNLSALRAGGN